MERTDSLPATMAAAGAADGMRPADSIDTAESDIRRARLGAARTPAPLAGEVTEETAEAGGGDDPTTSHVSGAGAIFADPGAGIPPLGGAEVGGRADVRAGMEVAGFDGESVGLVKEVRETDFLLDRVMRRDLYVPLSAVERVILDVTPERVVLNVRGADVAVMEWESPPLV